MWTKAKAQAEARRLKALLGRGHGWNIYVFENLGWHVYANKGSLNLSVDSYGPDDEVPMYSCMLGDHEDSGGGSYMWHDHSHKKYHHPRQAIARCVRLAKPRVAEINRVFNAAQKEVKP